MQNTFDQPDLELALRGRPAELQPLRVEVVPQSAPTRQRFPHRHLAVLARRKWLLLSLVAIGALAGLYITHLSPVLHTARISLEVTPPAAAEVVIRRASAGKVIDGCAQAIDLATLPEYARPANWFEALTRTPSTLPREEEFLPAVEHNVRFSPTSDGRVIDIDFQSSDPPRAAAFLDLLGQEVGRNHAEARTESVVAIRQSFAGQLAVARSDLEQSETAVAIAARAVGLSDPRLSVNSDARFLKNENDASISAIVSGEANRLSQAFDQARTKIADLRTEQAVRLDSRRQEFEAKRAAYGALLQQIRDAETTAANAGNVRPLAPARLISQQSRLPALLAVLLGSLAGLLVGIPICLARDATDRIVRDPEDIPDHTGIASLGIIPHAVLRSAARLGPGVPDLTGFPLFAPGPMTSVREVRSEVLSEAFRHVLASIWIAGQKNRRARVMLIASPGAREGKTTTMVNLGIALANTRRRVLILDANMRRPQLHMMFGAPPTWGLANLLESEQPVEDHPFEDLVFKTNIPGLYVLPAGSGHLSIAGMRHVDRMRDLLLRFRLEFHAVLIDTPSASDFPEARILARLSDAAVIVLRAGRSRRDRATSLAQQLEDDGAKVLGAVLNDYRKVH